jgi:hypothetical protein
VEVLARLQTVLGAEGVTSTPQGLEAVVFTADGDMPETMCSRCATSPTPSR